MSPLLRNTVLFIVLMALSAAFYACDNGKADDDDDDNNNDNDNDNNAGWPDNVKPIIGWFATQKGYDDESWAGLYYFDGTSVSPSQSIGDTVFQSGAMANVETAWATDSKTVYRVTGSGWQTLPSQPPCMDIDGKRVAGVAVFDNADNGYIACREPRKIWSWDGSQWNEVQTGQWSPNFGLHLDCLGPETCLAWNLSEMALFDGENFGGIELPGQLYSAGEAMLAANGDVLAGVYDPESEDVVHLMRYHSGLWGTDDHLPGNENWLFSPVIARLGDFTALSYNPGGGEEERTVILADNNEVIAPGWPRFNAMAFAPGGGGLAIDTNDRIVYWLKGLEMTPIYELAEDEVPSGFLVAADKE